MYWSIFLGIVLNCQGKNGIFQKYSLHRRMQVKLQEI